MIIQKVARVLKREEVNLLMGQAGHVKPATWLNNVAGLCWLYILIVPAMNYIVLLRLMLYYIPAGWQRKEEQGCTSLLSGVAGLAMNWLGTSQRITRM